MRKNAMAVLLVLASVLLISACGRKGAGSEVPAGSPERTDYVGDASSVVAIVSGQAYPEGYSYDSIEIQSAEEPYGLTVFLKGEPSAPELPEALQANAEGTFERIGNLGTLEYRTADGGELLAAYERP